MNQSNQHPESIEDVKKYLFKRIWLWTTYKPIWIKIAFGIGAVVIIIAFARLDIFGEPYSRYSKSLIPWRLPFDPALPLIPLEITYDIEDSMGIRPGTLGDNASTGDRIILTFKAGTKCWATVFCVDSKGIHPIFRGNLSPTLIDQNKSYSLKFKLDSTTGHEVYYVIAAHEKFDFDQDIKPHLKTVFPAGYSKGPVISKYKIKLPDRFVHDLVYFEHLSK